MTDFEMKTDFVAITADIVASHVANNSVAVGDVSALIETVYGALKGLGVAAPIPEIRKPQAVSVRASVKPDHLVCLACGAKLKTLKRHLRTSHESSPEQYRNNFGLPAAYPMTAPNYSERRRGMAKSSGLGMKPRTRVKRKASKKS